MENKNEVVCACRGVTDEQIRASVRNGAETLDKVKDETDCCKVCGLCIDDVQQIIADAKARADR